ncbi:MAG: cytochrome c [Gammaproteobacteria bacterium]|nr:cytochrome c [Gammaproteobacteria bacterium]
MKTKVIQTVLIFFAGISLVQADISGESLYMQNCMVCHADDGSGAMPGISDLVSNRSWSELPDELLLERITNGIKSQSSPAPMPPKGGNLNLSDNDLLRIIIYMKNEFQK